MFILILIIVIYLLYRLGKSVPHQCSDYNDNNDDYRDIKRSSEETVKLFPQKYNNRYILTVYDFDIAGVRYSDYYSRSSKVKELDEVFLVPIPENEYDSEAIAVYDENDIRIGWMPNIQTTHKHDLFEHIEQGRMVLAKVIKITDKYPACIRVAYARYSMPVIASEDSELYKNRIVEILNSAGKDTSILEFSLKKSNMFVKIKDHQILKIKFDGRIQYMLLNIAFDDFIMPQKCSLKYSKASKPEGDLTRIYIEELNDLNYFRDYIIYSFEKEIKEINN